MNNFDNWIQSLNNMSFDEYSHNIKDKILQSNMDAQSKQQFSDCFDYVYKLYKSNKPLDVNLFKIYLEEIKGYKNIKMSEFINMMILLCYCGFNISFDKLNNLNIDKNEIMKKNE